MDTDTIIAAIIAIVSGGGLVIQIPASLLNKIQKAMTVIDNYLLEEAAKDADHAKMWTDLRAKIDDAYTQIADGTVTVAEAWRALKDIKDAYDLFEAYEAPIVKKDLETLISEFKAKSDEVLKEIEAVKVTVTPPATVPK
jgi:hypothetical protein